MFLLQLALYFSKLCLSLIMVNNDDAVILLDPCLNREIQSENQINTALSLMIFFHVCGIFCSIQEIKKCHFALTLKPKYSSIKIYSFLLQSEKWLTQWVQVAMLVLANRKQTNKKKNMVVGSGSG